MYSELLFCGKRPPVWGLCHPTCFCTGLSDYIAGTGTVNSSSCNASQFEEGRKESRGPEGQYYVQVST